jgi:c-di-GMP-binding flagellar brake protein YcgR
MEEMDRKYKRGNLILPVLLKDKASTVIIKAVILNISKTGLRILTNDKLLRTMGADILKTKTFYIDFDFFDIDTSHIEGQIVNVKPGERNEYEKQLGVKFTKIDPIVARDINRIVMGELE